MNDLTWVVLARVEDGDSLFADDPITAPMLAEMARVYDPKVRMAPVISGYDPSTNTAGPAHFSGEYTPPLGYVRALEFDGREDSIYHLYDLDGRQHMEYLAYRGEYPDVPLAAMREDFRRHYPGVAENLARSDFDRDVEAEVGAAS